MIPQVNLSAHCLLKILVACVWDLSTIHEKRNESNKNIGTVKKLPDGKRSLDGKG